MTRRPLIEEMRNSWGLAATVKSNDESIRELQLATREGDLIVNHFSAAGGGGGDVSAHLSDTSDAHDASAISIADAGGHYTATDVEAALAEVAVEARQDFKSITITDPTVQTVRFYISPYAHTITEVKTNLVGGTSVTFNIEHGTNPTSGTANLWSSDEVANTLTAAETQSTSYNDATIADEEVISIDISAVSGTVTQFLCTVYFTRD
jgi:hypothetical protein